MVDGTILWAEWNRYISVLGEVWLTNFKIFFTWTKGNRFVQRGRSLRRIRQHCVNSSRFASHSFLEVRQSDSRVIRDWRIPPKHKVRRGTRQQPTQSPITKNGNIGAGDSTCQQARSSRQYASKDESQEWRYCKDRSELFLFFLSFFLVDQCVLIRLLLQILRDKVSDSGNKKRKCKWVKIANVDETNNNEQTRVALVERVRELYDNNYKEKFEGLKTPDGNLLSNDDIREMIEEGGHEATRLYSEFEDAIELLKVEYLASLEPSAGVDTEENVNENVDESANSADDHMESGHESSSSHSDAGDIIDAGDDVSAVLTMVNNTRGEFTEAESNMVIRGLVKYGEDWVSIAQLIPGRDSTQVRKRYWRMKQSKTWKRIIQRKNEYLATLSGDDSGSSAANGGGFSLLDGDALSDDSGSSAANGGEFNLLDGDPTSERDTPQGSVLIQSGSSVDAQDAQFGESRAMNIRTGTSTVDASGSANLSTGSDSSSMNSTSTLDQFGSSSSGTMSTATERIEHMLEERRQQALLVSQLQFLSM